MKIQIDNTVTEQQRLDPRFQKLLRDAEEFFKGSNNRAYKLKLGLHEAGHIFYAKRAGGINIQRYGPTMFWDQKYGCPAISKSSIAWTPAIGGSVVAHIKARIGGFVCRRELSDEPNDNIAIEMDLQGAREYFDQTVGTGDDAFKQAVEDAEREILEDLQSQSVVDELWAEAKRFVKEVFQPQPAPKAKTKRIKIGRNEPCFCGSGRKFKKCHLSQQLPEPLAA